VVINNASANSSRRSFTTNYTSGLHSQSIVYSIARIGTFFARVIETLEHNAISESHEVLRDQTHRERMNRPLQFHKRRQLFIGTHNETLAFAMRVSNPEAEWIRDKTSRLTPDVQVQQKRCSFRRRAQ
jgi:hypothetical protein